MTNIFVVRTAVFCIATVAALTLAALPANADHGEEAEESHATSIHAHEVEVEASAPVTTKVTYAPTIDVAKVTTMQELLKALQQLVVLLTQQKAQIEHDTTPHEHDEDDAHEEETEDDTHDNHDEDHA